MGSFRDQLRAGVLTVATKVTFNTRTHKFKGNCTIDEGGFCDFEPDEGNYFLLKSSHTNRRNRWHITR